MTDTVKCVSDHAEDLDDGRTLAVGQIAEDVDLTKKSPGNQRLLEEGRIIKITSSQQKVVARHDVIPPPPEPDEDEGDDNNTKEAGQ